MINLGRWSAWATRVERAALTACIATFFIVGYFCVGLSRNPALARELALPVDRHIPFIAGSVWVYLWAFSAALIPLFMVRCPRLLRRTALAYTTVIAASLVCFTVFPVTSARLRVPSWTLDTARPSDWAVSVVYYLDPPYNLFPSAHLSIAATAALSVWKVARPSGAAIFVGVGLVAVSVCTIKQHFLVDVIGGLVLAALASALILPSYHPQIDTPPAYTWRGPVSYLFCLVLFYTGFYVAYLYMS
jgi:membrane-associated phospholipid phosphatase